MTEDEVDKGNGAKKRAERRKDKGNFCVVIGVPSAILILGLLP